MSKSKFRAINVSCWLIAFLVVGIIATRSFSQPDMYNLVPVETARKAAQIEVSAAQLLEEWDGAIVSPEDPAVFLNLDHYPIAYVFKVTKNGEYKGYITVSASYDFYPIREYSLGPFPTQYLENCRRKADSLIGTLSEKHELIYLGGTIYLVEFISASGASVVVSLSPFGMVIPEENLERAQLSLERKANEIGQKAGLAWMKVQQ